MRGDTTLIEIRLKESSQLFDNRDPAPFIERDLDPDAVDYLVGAVSELRSHRKFAVVIYLAAESAKSLSEIEIREAIHGFFAFQTQLIRGRIQLLLRRGRFALIVGLATMLFGLGRLVEAT